MGVSVCVYLYIIALMAQSTDCTVSRPAPLLDWFLSTRISLKLDSTSQTRFYSPASAQSPCDHLCFCLVTLEWRVRHFSLCLHAVTGEAFQLLNLKGACTKAVPKSFIFPDEKKLYFKSIHGWNSRRISFHLAVHLVSSFWVKKKKTTWVDVGITVSRKDIRCQNWRQVNGKQQPLGLKKPTHKCQKLQFFYSRWL